MRIPMEEEPLPAPPTPGVVAILVVRDPGTWFEEVLEGFAAQDYPNLSVLVLLGGRGEGEDPGAARGGAVDPAAMVAAALPDAFVHRVAGNPGFGAAVNEALAMVEGAAFFCLSHDDCAPAPDALRLMVEESFRSNAGIVSPKMVRWDDARRLLHVGQSVDKTGKLIERVQDSEVDVGQHDAVRDVFVAPGGLTLVRADLLHALGGYDPEIVAMGEDLDLSWRAHLVGARIVVAPEAVARHLELVAGDQRPPPRSSAPSIQALQRRHELRTVLIAYSLPHLARILPQSAVLALGEIVVSVLVGDRRRAGAVIHAWRWNLSELRALRRRRAEVQQSRAAADRDVRSLQIHGSARLSLYLSRLVHHGASAAHGMGRTATAVAGDSAGADGVPLEAPEAGSAIGQGFSEDAEFDELDDLGRVASRSEGHPGFFASRRARLAGWLVAAAVLVIGTRGLLAGGLPLIGQFVPFPSWTSTWHTLFAPWQLAGLGSSAPPSPAFGLLGLLGTVVFGRMGFLQLVVVLGCVPLGGWGMARLLAPIGSARGRFAGTVAYLFLPLAYDALARGRWDGLVAFAAAPWMFLQLARASGAPPFAGDAAPAGQRSAPSWRWSVLALGALEAASAAFAPATAVLVLLVAMGVAAGSLLFAGRAAAWRVLSAGAGATVVAAVLLAPWVVGTVVAGHAALTVFGLPGGSASQPSWGDLLRLAVGPIGGSPLGWGILGAAVAPLLVANEWRFAWAVRLWVVAVFAWLLALVAVKAWAVPFAPSVDVMLAPAAAAISASVGIGVAALEADLAGRRFGWRQGVAAISVVALIVGLLPTVAEAANGRWGTPPVGYAQAAELPPVSAPHHGYRVLWLGDPRALPLGAWPVGPGLAFGTSTNGTPTLADLWPPASPGRAAELGNDVELAMRGGTVQLGSMLAIASVRYVVVVRAVAPQLPGAQPSPTFPGPAGLVGALARQGDLKTVPVSVGSLTVFENTASPAPPVNVLATPATATARWADPLAAALLLVLWALLGATLVRWRRRLRRSRRRGRGANAGRHRATHAGEADGSGSAQLVGATPAQGDTG